MQRSTSELPIPPTAKKLNEKIDYVNRYMREEYWDGVPMRLTMQHNPYRTKPPSPPEISQSQSAQSFTELCLSASWLSSKNSYAFSTSSSLASYDDVSMNSSEMISLQYDDTLMTNDSEMIMIPE